MLWPAVPFSRKSNSTANAPARIMAILANEKELSLLILPLPWPGKKTRIYGQFPLFLAGKHPARY
jgi:hypothetical protein